MQKAIGGYDVRSARAANGPELFVNAVNIGDTKPLGTDSALRVIVV